MLGVTERHQLAALRCQATQAAALVALLGEDTMRDWCATEAFVAAAALVPAG